MAAEQVLFPPFRLDLVGERLWCDTRVIPLRPKTFAVLRYLVERPGRLVTNEELLQAVWPGIAVSETMPRLSIGEIRRALGDDAKQPRVIETSPRRGYRFIAAIATAAPPRQFVGRAAELALLHSRLAAVRQGAGQVVGMSGDPGIGKTRLLAEFCQGLAEHNVRYLEGHCLAYGTAVPGLPLLDLLRQHCQITGGDRPEIIPHKIQSGLQTVGMDAEADAPFLLQLLGRPEGTERLARFSPETIKARTIDILQQLLLRLSRQQPLVVALEDLQWMDHTSTEFFAALVERLPGAAVLLLTTYRSGYRPVWIEKSYVTQMALQPLAPHDSLTLLQALLPAAPLPEALAQEMLTKAEGNPFFLEELAKAVQEHSDVRRLRTVPETIQRVLQARIDRLPEPAKRLLQTAAVLGREFSVQVLSKTWQQPGDLPRTLGELQQAELLYAHGSSQALLYRFKHVLTHEVAYETLLAPQRMALHAVTAQALETLYADRLEEVAERLAHHYAQTDHADKAITYLTHCAAKAARVYANSEAVHALQEALGQVERLPAAERPRRRLDVSLRLAFSLTVLGRFGEVLALLQPQQAQLEQLQEPSLAGPYYFRLGMIYFYLGDYEHATQHAQRALEEARRCADQATAGKALYVLTAYACSSGHFRQGIEHGGQAVALLVPTEESHYLSLAYMVLGLNYALSGEFAAALEAEAQVQSIGESVEDQRLQSFAALSRGWIYAMMGEWETALAACQRGVECAPDPFSAASALGYQGYAYLEQGDVAHAVPLLEHALQQGVQLRARPQQNRFMLFLGEAYLLDGQLEKARALVQQGDTLSQEINAGFWVAWAQRALGKITQAEGRWVEAEAQLTAALQSFTAMSARFEIGRTHLALATLAQSRGDGQTAAHHLTTAHHLFSALQVSRYRERAAQCARELGLALS